MKPVEILVIGAGNRGTTYADYAVKHPDLARIVGVAEPREFYRAQAAKNYHIPAENVVEDWQQLAERAKFADAVVIATQDALHRDPAIAFASKGYDILLEKPMAPDPASCQAIVDAAIENDIILAVGHVMRYTNYTQAVKTMLDSGIIGNIVSVQHLEPVGFWHYAHSYVRGNWRNEALSSFMLLAKSCHDLDWLRYLIGQRCVQVSSFGSQMHFRKENKPAEAGEAKRCLDCAFESDCAYSAPRFYLDRVVQRKFQWPIDVITSDRSYEGVLNVLRNGPYGRCVYECDNDVVDHQVVNLLYENGTTATFTMIAESEMRSRETIIFGTKGELRGNGEEITHYDFLSKKTTKTTIQQGASGHGGGDYGLMQRFVNAVAHQDPSKVLSGPAESLETHLTVFAAERARRECQVVHI